MKEYEYLCAHSADWCASRMCKSRCCLIDTQSPLYIFTTHTEVSIDRSLFPTYVFYLQILNIQILFHIRHIVRSGSAVMRSSNRFVLYFIVCAVCLVCPVRCVYDFCVFVTQMTWIPCSFRVHRSDPRDRQRERVHAYHTLRLLLNDTHMRWLILFLTARLRGSRHLNHDVPFES